MTDDGRAEIAQWSKDARQRSRKAMLHQCRQRSRTERRLFDVEERMERAAQEYQRALLAGSHLSPMQAELHVTAREIPLEPW